MLNSLQQRLRRIPLLERFARRLLDRRYQLARRYLRGVGIEIGALDRPLLLPRAARAFYLDRLLPAQLREHYPELGARQFYVSLVANGEQLECIRDGSLNFLVANHVIEHCEDPISALLTFAAKLQAGGIIFLAVPDMRKTFDRDRDETTWDHLWQDYTNSPALSRRRHYREWVSAVEGNTDELERRAAALEAQDYSIHFHCWSRLGFLDFLRRLSAIAPLTLAASAAWRNENIFILRKEPEGSGSPL